MEKNTTKYGPCSGKIKTVREVDQTLELLDEDFKSAILNMLNKTMRKK